MIKKLIPVVIIVLAASCAAPDRNTIDQELAKEITNNAYFSFVKDKALEVMKTGFNAGDGYREVWIRDYNTFIELASRVYDQAVLKENLLVFFRMQGDDGNIIDGFTPAEKIGAVEYDFSYSELEPRYAGHKNTVETDQESSLVQAVSKYVKITGDRTLLDEIIGGKTVKERLEWSMDFLMSKRFNRPYGLITGATTADWGDVQPEHGWGVDVDANTHMAIDIYDNAMFIIALNDLMEMIPEAGTKWGSVKDSVMQNCRKHLWDQENQKFIPHIYLNGSPFPADFNENIIYYFGGTAVAIEAGLLSREEVRASLAEMVKRVKLAGAGSIGLTLYPPYPAGYFANKIMNTEYSYQNGGDWTWFGGRMIQQLIRFGFYKEAYDQIQSMVKRVKDNDGFYEWYSVDNKPRGSGTFRGEAGVLFTAIRMLERASRNDGPDFGGWSFRFDEVTGIGYEAGVTRRDPSDIIRAGDTWYIYYTKVYGRSPGYWGTVWCAASVDEGFSWTEKGEVLGKGNPGTFDSHAVFTPNILADKGKYYLFYTGVKPTPGNEMNDFENNSTTDITAIGVAVSDSPGSPFNRLSNDPVLEVSADEEDFDSYRVDDASLLYRDGEYRLYYKGRSRRHGEGGPAKTEMGVAFSKKPYGPFTKQGPAILSKSHEVLIWPQDKGVAALASISSTLEYAPDGLHFEGIYSERVLNRPSAPGLFRPDLTAFTRDGKSPAWGISMGCQGNDCFLKRFEVSLRAARANPASAFRQ